MELWMPLLPVVLGVMVLTLLLLLAIRLVGEA